MTFVNIFLGTDTQFTPEPSDVKGYDNPETLSYVATLINPEAHKIDDVIEHQHEKVVVINGPDTLGSKVGHRIALGVLEMLKAISRGEKTICIAGHSRGAVESILASHELQRIKTLLQNNQLRIDNIIKSECLLTQKEMGALKAEFEKLDLDAIKPHLHELNVSLFCIDPVPGGSVLGTNALTSITFTPTAWRDPRFYKLPPIVSNYYQILNENERTRGFKPIIPAAMDAKKTKVTIESLPGHHGSACGNLKDQQRKRFQPETGSDAVQKLTIAKLVEFLRQHDVNMSPRDDFFPECLTLSSDSFLRLYDTIYDNKSVFERFNATSYAVLGQEQSIAGIFFTVRKERIIHHHQHTDTFHNDIFPPVMNFVNQQHAYMVLQKTLGLTDKLQLAETFRFAINKLLDICRHASGLSSPEPAANMTESMLSDKVAEALTKPKTPTAQLLDKIINSLMEDIKQTFLLNQFGSIEERQSLIQAIIEGYQQFKSVAVDNDYAKSIFQKLKRELELTLNQKQKLLANEYDKLIQKFTRNHFMNDLLSKISILKNSCKTEHKDFLETMHNELAVFNTVKFNIDEVTTNLSQYKETIRGFEIQDEYLLILDEIIDNSLADINTYTASNIFEQLKDIFEQHERLNETVPALEAMDTDLDVSKSNLAHLSDKQNLAILCSAQYIISNDISLEICRDILGETHPLFIQIEAFYRGLQREGIVTKKEFELLESEILRLTAENEDKIELILDKTAEFLALTTLNKAVVSLKDEQIVALTQEKDALVTQLTQEKDALFTQLTQEKDALVTQLTQEKDTELVQLTQTNKNLDRIIQEHYNPEYIQTQAKHLVILDKLRVLTQNYQTQLIKEVQTIFKVRLDPQNPNLEDLIVTDTETLKKNLKDKLTAIGELNAILSENKPASEKTNKFYRRLVAENFSDKNHDSDWKTYCNRALKLLALILTGILPGVIYCAYDRSNLFWTSDKRFIEKTQEVLLPVTPTNPV